MRRKKWVAIPFLGLLALLVVLAGAGAGTAWGESAPGVAWRVTVTGQPTNIVTAGGSYSVVVTNIGSVASSGPVTVTASLPAGMNVTNANGYAGVGWGCSGGGLVVTCSWNAPVAVFESTVDLLLEVGGASAVQGETVAAHFFASGGGAPVAQTSLSGVVGEAFPAFGLTDFQSQTYGLSGAPDTQAGDHPAAMVVALDTTQSGSGAPQQRIKRIELDLPTGLGANPQALARCSISDVYAQKCPASSRVGTLLLNYTRPSSLAAGVLPIYNVVPERGHPAEFAFYSPRLGRAVFFYGSVRSGSDYGLHISIPDIPEVVELANVLTIIYGDPQQVDGSGNLRVPFFTNPSQCSGQPLTTKIEAYTYQEPERPIVKESTMLPVANCDLLQFNPSISLTPSTTQADEPAGYAVDVNVPQHEDIALEGLATPDLKSVTVTLPAGLTISPAAADGLTGCPSEGTGGFNLHSDTPGECPLASQVGIVEASTPVLPGPLHGHIYFAQPGCGGAGQPACNEADALDGTLFKLYLELEGFGVVIKQAGIVAANPQTGQLTSTFASTPQQPVEDLKVVFKGGPRAPLANPQACGEALMTSDLTPSSSPETPDGNPSFAYQVTGCEGNPFKPGFLAGTTPNNAGAFTDFQVGFSREDREQNLSQISLRTPPGLLGMLSSVPLCGESQAQQGTCPEASRIASTSVAVGAGSHPLWVQGGRIYLTGPYRGEPFGLSVVVPAVAGPFNLGNVILRGAIAVDPHTSALTVVTDPFPRILDGVPLRIRQVHVSVDRSGFMFNPTSCAPQQVTATLQSIQGSSAQVSTPFAAGGCKNLPFKPKFSVYTRGKTSHTGGASLYVKLTAKPGDANIARVKVDLPKQLPSRLTTLQKACTAAQFDSNPAGCPAASIVGTVRASTPVLPVQLSGPVYFVSHGGEAFPDLEIVLQGEGVRVDLVGSTFISKAGITSSTFKTVPDVPVRSFELYLPQGRYSALTANGSLCKQQAKLTMPTMFIAQNGATIKQNTKIAVTGCAKAKRANRTKGSSRRGGRSSVHRTGL